MAMAVVGHPHEASLKRKWWDKSAARRSNQRYTNENVLKVVKGTKIQDTGSRKKRRLNSRGRIYSVPRTVPRAPYNDSSFLMRVRQAGGLESQMVALTPFSYMSTPKDSSYKLDTYDDFVNHEDYGYGSMTGLIRLRADEGSDRSSGSGCSTVENNSDTEHSSVPVSDSVDRVEERVERGVSRFEMTHPAVAREADALTELRVARQDCHIKYLEDENLVLQQRLSLLQQEIYELRQRMLSQGGKTGDVDVSDESDHDEQSCLGR